MTITIATKGSAPDMIGIRYLKAESFKNERENQLKSHADGSGVRLYDGSDIKLFILVGWDRSFLSVAWPTGVQLVFFFYSGDSKLFGAQGSPSSGSLLKL